MYLVRGLWMVYPMVSWCQTHCYWDCNNHCPHKYFPWFSARPLVGKLLSILSHCIWDSAKNWQLVGHSWVRLSVLGGGQGKAESKKERLRARTSQQLWRQAERCVSWEKIDCQTNAKKWMDITQPFYKSESAANPPAFIFRIFCHFFFLQKRSR